MTGPDLDLPGRDVLDRWAVPPPPPDLTDRVLLRLETETEPEPEPEPEPEMMRAPRSLAWWGAAAATGLAVVALALLLGRLPPFEGGGPAPGVTAPPRTDPRSPAAAQTTLVVITHPVDAEVRLDGNEVKGPTPHVAGGVETGPHRVRVAREGFLPYEREVAFGEGSLQLPVRLERAQVLLQTETDPAQARVELRTNGVGAIIDRRHLLRRRPGTTYELEVTAPGFRSRRLPLALGGESEERVVVTLELDPTAPASSRRTKVASPDLKDPSLGRRSPALPPAPAPESASLDLTDSPPKTCTLAIAGLPGIPPARVWIDGEAAGRTPVPKFMVRPGQHTVTCEWTGVSSRVQVTAIAGQRTVVRCRKP